MNDLTTPINPFVMGAADVARMIGVSPITLLRLRQAKDCGGLPFIQISTNRIGYLRSDVLAFLAARRVGKLPVAAPVDA